MVTENGCLRCWAGVTFLAAVSLLMAACGGKQDEVEVQRKLVRVATTSTPRPDKKGVKPKVSPTKTQGGKTPPPQTPASIPTAMAKAPAVAKNSPSPAPMARPSPSPRPVAVFVTTHTLGQVDPRAAATYRVEGSGLGGCRIYLRRYGVETELVPSSKSDSVAEFANAEWLFLERGAYDLVLRDGNGRELILPEAVRVE